MASTGQSSPRTTIWLVVVGIVVLAGVAYVADLYPPADKSLTGSVVPAERYRAETSATSSSRLALGDQSVAQFMQTDLYQKIVTDKEMAKKLVQSHLMSGKLPSADLKGLDGKEVRMANGLAFKVEDTKDGLRVSGVKITTSNVQCSNGVIHVIDAVFPTATE